MASTTENKQNLCFLKSNFPVFFPTHPALLASENEVDALIEPDVKRQLANGTAEEHFSGDDTATAAEFKPVQAVLVSDASTTAGLPEDLVHISVGDIEDTPMTGVGGAAAEATILTLPTAPPTKDILVDLFAELEDAISGPRLLELLYAAWHVESASTLKIIFNALPSLTLIANLSWLSRPVIQKKAETKDTEKKSSEGEMVFVEQEMDENDPARFDVRNRVAHGYWKDLLNILALYVNGKPDALANRRDILNIEREKSKTNWPKDEETAKALQRGKGDDRHDAAIKVFEEDAIYRAWHITAPSNARFHEKHTFVVSSIAEMMHPLPTFEGFAQYDENNKDLADEPATPIPSEKGTALVSGYSQGMLKVFLANGSFEEAKDAEEEIVEKIGDDGEVIVEKTKPQKMDPMSVRKKAIGHPYYKTLRVVD
ncbi:hypothetical protein diail_5886 [Diaporthe ilicicola]|nr:hypothetical protein diail_5886 [Diaporthe ilicicola]